jgi:hypothetical protein
MSKKRQKTETADPLQSDAVLECMRRMSKAIKELAAAVGKIQDRMEKAIGWELRLWNLWVTGSPLDTYPSGAKLRWLRDAEYESFFVFAEDLSLYCCEERRDFRVWAFPCSSSAGGVLVRGEDGGTYRFSDHKLVVCWSSTDG